jgi:hypothetical protein
LPPISGASLFGKGLPDDSAVVGSPMKKARPSIAGLDDINGAAGTFPALGNVLAKAEAAEAAKRGEEPKAAVIEGKGEDKEMEEEEL